MLTTVKPARSNRSAAAHTKAAAKRPATQARVPIVAAPGDGIGPEIMTAVLRIVEAAGARLDVRSIDVGEKIYRQGITSGIDPAAWDALRERGVTDFTQEPTDHFYGTDMGLRDPFGNAIRVLQQGKGR